MGHYRVVYTDPMWAVDQDGNLDPEFADVERAVFPDDVDLEFGLRRDGKFLTDGPEFLQWVSGADAVVVYRATVGAELLKVLSPNCKVVARQGVGIDNLDIAEIANCGIPAFNVPDYCVDEVATHTIGLLLAVERQICVQNRAVKADNWDIFLGGKPRRLQNLTAGIIGFGRIGRAVSRRLETFYGNIISYDPWVHDDLMTGYGVRKVAELEDFLSRSDVVLLHAALNDDSRQIINRTSLRHLKTGAVLVNAARGGLVEPAAVLEGLISGWLGGYAVDVFSPEDPNQDPTNRQILTFDNVVVSSHRAFLSGESEVSQRRRVSEEVRHVLFSGKPPRFGRVA